MEFKNYSIEKFIDELKRDLPSPGGGSTAALISSLALALNSMVYSFTIDKKPFEKLSEENKEKMKRFKEESDRFIENALLFMEEDRKIFIALMDSFKLPKETEEEKFYRSAVIKEKTVKAMKVPFELAKKSCNLYNNIEFAIEYGNKNLISDGVVAASILHSAIESAIINVNVNLSSLAECDEYRNIKNQCKDMLEESLKRKNRIIKLFMD